MKCFLQYFLSYSKPSKPLYVAWDTLVPRLASYVVNTEPLSGESPRHSGHAGVNLKNRIVSWGG